MIVQILFIYTVEICKTGKGCIELKRILLLKVKKSIRNGAEMYLVTKWMYKISKPQKNGTRLLMVTVTILT